jgi:transcriptional regulator with XRE-family HTH domain
MRRDADRALDEDLSEQLVEKVIRRVYALPMQIGQKLRELRVAKNLSQGDIEKRTGLLRCYTSRVENGYTVPALETLEKYARALEIPLYKLFYDGKEPPKKPKLPHTESAERLWGTSAKQWSALRRLTKMLSRMDWSQRKILLGLAQRIAARN